MNWILGHWIEIFGVVTGLLYLFLEIRANIWLWPVGILTTLAYIFVFFQTKFYADMGLQFYYLILSIYGWFHWWKGNAKNEEVLPIRKTDLRLGTVLSLIFLVLWYSIWMILVRFTDSPVPVGDSFTTALSIIATWMLARKLIELWWLWVVVNFVSLSLYIYKDLYPTAIMYFVFAVMSVYGYYTWKKDLRSAGE